METYWGMHASEIKAGDFFRFAWERRRELRGFLRWAERMRAGA
jgi:hypothetical protein